MDNLQGHPLETIFYTKSSINAREETTSAQNLAVTSKPDVGFCSFKVFFFIIPPSTYTQPFIGAELNSSQGNTVIAVKIPTVVATLSGQP